MPLDTAEVEKLVRSGETLRVEFKSEDRQALSGKEVYEAIVCLANSEGVYCSSVWRTTDGSRGHVQDMVPPPTPLRCRLPSSTTRLRPSTPGSAFIL